jgi:hypothetical protein
MKWCLSKLLFVFFLVCLTSTMAFAQGGSAKSSLSGVVVDTGGGVIPGATVTVKNDASGVVTTATTNSAGVFSLPALDVATYTVTITLQGFKTVTVKDVRIIAGQSASVPKVTLEIGALSETVEVKAGTELVQTQSGTVSSTLQTEQLKAIPLPTRNSLYAVNMLPGVDTTGTVRDSTIAGLPEQTINITLDGVNVNNNQDKAGDGFYAMVRPNLDAIEQVTLSTAAQGADSAGQGAVQIRFVTRSGTNTYKGTAYDYFRHPSLNSNSWVNIRNGLPRNRIILHQAGASLGGPMKIPGLFDGTGKAFFFFNYEEFYQPTEATRSRTLLNTNAQQGLFLCSTCTGGPLLKDLMSMAAGAGHTSTIDPTIQALLAQIRTAAGTKGNITTPPNATNTQNYLYNSPGKGTEHLPTTSVDFNLSPAHRLRGVYYWQEVNRIPDIQNNGDPTFPGLPNVGNYLSHRTAGSITLRSTLTSSLVNELIGGWQDSPGYFGSGITASQFENQDFYTLSFPLGATTATRQAGGVEHPRNTPNWNIDDTVTLQRGQHSLSFGGSFSQFKYTNVTSTVVPTVNFGIQTGLDPADTMFGTAAGNFPGASNGEVNDARALYAFLTGRVTSINASAALNDAGIYEYIGDTNHRIRLNQYGLWAQDAWRITPSLTLNYGARWEVQMPVRTLIKSYSTATIADICGPSGLGNGPGGRPCNLFAPGVFNAAGQVPTFTQYQPDAQGYNTDWNNVAPNVSVAWRPNVQSGFLRTLLGDPESATIRAGYSIAYNRQGMVEFTNIFGANTGRTTNANRNNTIGNLVLAGEQWPLLFRDKSRLGPPPTCPATGTGPAGCVPIAVAYPLTATINNNVNIFDPNLQLSYTHSYQIGIQRAISRDMVVEVRYVGNQNKAGWITENWNEVNIFENGFLEEFKVAQANLAAHVAAGCGGTGNPCSFAYRGAGTNTSPLPIYLANITGQTDVFNQAMYTGTSWTNGTFVGRLDPRQPSPTGAAGDLFGNANFRANMATAGLPANFWVMNPLIAGANVRSSTTFTKYHSIQTEVRRRLSRGLLVGGSYTWSRPYTSQSDGLHFPRYLVRSTQNNNVPHSFKINGLYEIPFGRGRRFGTNSGNWMNNIAGGWTLSMTGRVQTRAMGISGVRLVGMTNEELQREFRFRIDNSVTPAVVTMLPQDIIDNTRRAFQTSATSATGYSALGVPGGRYIAPADTPTCIEIRLGDCGEPKQIFLNTPLFARFDMSLKKQFPLGGRKNFELQFDVNNVFNAINFTPVFNPGGGGTIFQVTAGNNPIYTDISQSYDPGGRLGQIVFRFNW